MKKLAIVFFSGYGHTQHIAEAVAADLPVELIEIDQEGNITDEQWSQLADAKAIVFGTPTYMGGVPWQFKKFADASSKVWATRGWQDKIFGGFTNSASMNGDKQVTLSWLQTFACQHGGIWVSLGLLPSNTKTTERNDSNYLGASVGAMVQTPSDASVDEVPAGDIETVKTYIQRVADIAAKIA